MKSRQKGTTTVEFAIIAVVFFIVLFGVIEIGRALFVWNTLTEATRRGARVAAVCPVLDPETNTEADPESDIVRRVTVFGPGGGTSTTSPILSGLTTANVDLAYLNENGGVVADPEETGFSDIHYVRVSIKQPPDPDFYQITLLIPFVAPILTALPFETTLPRESLGVVPGVNTPSCDFPPLP